MGFLIPAIEKLYKHKESSGLTSPSCVSVLIISPTRELAQQIAEEAKSLLTYHPFAVQCFVGGTNINADLRALNSDQKLCDIVVATPGRLLDHLENSPLKSGCSQLKTLILDEADRLLEEGFRSELEKILALLPNNSNQAHPRQTLLFSATLPKSVHQVASLALLPDYKFITTVSDSDSTTHDHLPQHSIVTELSHIFPITLGLIEHELKSNPNPKIMAFFPTARGTQLASELFHRALGISVHEIHSRMSQSARTKTTDNFRTASSGIMFSSDVSARGMHFPGVTLVLQVGLPASKEQCG